MNEFADFRYQRQYDTHVPTSASVSISNIVIGARVSWAWAGPTRCVVIYCDGTMFGDIAPTHVRTLRTGCTNAVKIKSSIGSTHSVDRVFNECLQYTQIKCIEFYSNKVLANNIARNWYNKTKRLVCDITLKCTESHLACIYTLLDVIEIYLLDIIEPYLLDIIEIVDKLAKTVLFRWKCSSRVL